MADVFSRGPGPSLPVRGSMRYAQIVQRPYRAGEECDGKRSDLGSPLRLRESSGQLSESSLLGSLRILHMGKTLGAREFHLELEAQAGPRDGLHAAENVARRHRKKEPEEAL